LSQEPHGNDNKGYLLCAVANTEWGKIPGYVRDNSCYFEYCGARNSTDFTLVKGAVLTDDPNEISPLGDENGEELYCALVHTLVGTIPGKARMGNCKYVYDGQSYESRRSFSYLGPRRTPLDFAAAVIRAKVRTIMYIQF
jgi:hypothetical protein